MATPGDMPEEAPPDAEGGASPAASVHGSCVRVGEAGVLIRGPSGAGKSRLAFALILAGRTGMIAPTTLVSDDRVLLRTHAGALVASAPPEIAGLIEVRGAGIRRIEAGEEAVVALVVDLGAADGARLPEPESTQITLRGVIVPRLPVAPGMDPAPLVIALLTTQDGTS